MKKKHLLPFLLLIIFLQNAVAVTISGTVTDENDQSVPFASIYIKGTTKGTTSNIQGFYSIEIPSGKVELVFRLIGYKLEIKEINTADGNQILNVKLTPESILLKEAIIMADAEDPAYAVIRQAQKKRKFYLEQVKAYSCDVYIKGEQRITKVPSSVMGIKIDSTQIKPGIIYLSESVSKFNFKQPNKIKEIMVSSKVSGDNQAFSYNQASDILFNFYENLIQIQALSEVGFISPISNTALLTYRYKLLGTFFEDGQMINKIAVTPKRKNDPAFSGIINIMENSWRIHSVQLLLTKDAQIEFVDTLKINQTFLPVEKDIWLPFNTKFSFNFGLFGIEGDGMYVSVNSNYLIDPEFPKNYFTNEVMKVSDSANKKDSVYWQNVRPIQLTNEEKVDYLTKDSIAIVEHSKPYLDSIDKKSNKFKFSNLFLGYTHTNTYKRQEFSLSAPLEGFQFNTVQGFNLTYQLNFSKTFENFKNYNVGGKIGYGFSNLDFYGSVHATYLYKPVKFASIKISGGKEYSQFNDHPAILPLFNSLYSLLNEQNFMKIYSKYYVKLQHSSELFNGFYFTPSIEYADRKSLTNSTGLTWVRSNYNYTSNDPQDPLNNNYSFKNNQSLDVDLKIRYVFKQKYSTAPNIKTVMGSKFPAFVLNYKKGINAFGSDVDYDLLTICIEHSLDLKRIGRSTYSITAGSFLNNRKMYFMDWYHFNGNQTLYSGFGLSDFQLLEYYATSTNKQFIEGHLEHNFLGLILNQIPLIKKLKLQEVGKLSVLTSDGKNTYGELSIGVQRLGFRVDFVTGFSNQSKISSGIRIGIQLN